MRYASWVNAWRCRRGGVSSTVDATAPPMPIEPEDGLASVLRSGPPGHPSGAAEANQDDDVSKAADRIDSIEDPPAYRRAAPTNRWTSSWMIAGISIPRVTATTRYVVMDSPLARYANVLVV